MTIGEKSDVFDVHLLFENNETDQMGRFRYWLLGDLILRGWSDHANHRIVAAQFLEMPDLHLSIIKN